MIEHFKQAVLAGGMLGTDDTPVTLLLPKNIPEPSDNDLKSQRIHDVFTRAVARGKPSVSVRMWAYRGMSLRRLEALPIWTSLGELLDELFGGKPAAEILPKSRFGQALGYIRKHWEPLQLYLSDGQMPIDNNDVEQLMKQVAVGRKNWLFIGSVAAGERAADFLTLVSSAVRNDLDVWAYVKDVLDRLLAGSTDYDALRPGIWKRSHAESVRVYRVQERRDRADRKQVRRSRRRVASAKSR